MTEQTLDEIEEIIRGGFRQLEQIYARRLFLGILQSGFVGFIGGVVVGWVAF